MIRNKLSPVFLTLIIFLLKVSVAFGQVPVITSFSPESGPAGTVVTINGNNLGNTGATVYFGAAKASIISETPAQIMVSVPSGATYEPITVTANSLTAYSGKPFTLTFNGSGIVNAQTFNQRTDFKAGTVTYGIAASDFDGDGKIDLVASNLNSTTLNVLKNNSTSGNVSFVSTVFSTQSNPKGVAVGDLDGDGKPDIAVTNFASNTVSVYLNTSSGNNISFKLEGQLNTGESPYGIAIGDFDGDGKPDIVVANDSADPPEISVFRNLSLSPGSISFSDSIDLPIGGFPTSVSIADIDGDGKPDIIATDDNFNLISVYRNKSVPNNISFDSKVSVDIPNLGNPQSIAIGDFNGDGKLDIATADNNLNYALISIFKNTSTPGAISFSPRQDLNVGRTPFCVKAADINGDGKIDLIVLSSFNTVSVLVNSSTGNAIKFDPYVSYAIPNVPIDLAIADENGDGKPDIITGNNSNNNNVSVLLNNPVTSAIIPLSPNISYQTPQIYTANTAIAALLPTNTGGAVPPNAYGQVITFAGTGVTGTSDGTGTAASFSAPIGMTIDGSGNIFLADYNNNTIRKITPAAVVTTFSGIPGAHGAINGTGSNATFAEPNGVAVDGNGNIYVADSYNNMIRKITPGTTVSTYAGTGGVGAVNGPAPAATFSAPADAALDAAGNVYVTDKNNNMIRKISTLGQVTTLAGNPTAGHADGTGTAAGFNQPESLAVDAAGNVYVADTFNNLVRKITPSGVVTTLAGSGAEGSNDGLGTAASFYQPYGITVDASGTLYVADEKNNRIRKITPAGLVSTVAGNGTGGKTDGIGIGASFGYPGSIVDDGDGNLYVGDLTNFLIRKVSITGYTIDKTLPPGLTFDPTTGKISGTPTAASPATDYTVTAYNTGGSSSAIVNITVKATVVSVAPPNISYQTPQIYTLNTLITPLKPVNTGSPIPANIYGQVTTFAGSEAKGAADGQGTAATFSTPQGVAVDNNNNVYVADNSGTIRKITPAGLVSTLAGHLAEGSAINGAGVSARFNAPSGVAADAQGNIYVTDRNNNLIRKITPAGVVTTFAGSGAQGDGDGPAGNASFYDPLGIAVDDAGNVYVADEGSFVIRKISTTGIVATLAGKADVRGATDGTGAGGTFYAPYNIAIDANGNLFVADRLNNLIRKVTPAGVVTTVAGNVAGGSNDGIGAAASFSQPLGIAVDFAGNLYVSDTDNSLIRKITPLGVVTTIAGIKGQPGLTNGIGTAATISFPVGLAMDANANLYVADNSEIRKITLSGYTINKPLPAGLVFDQTTGSITGTPTAMSPPTDYTVTAYNAYGSSSAVVNITVQKPAAVLPAPPNISYQTPQTYTITTAIPALTPTNTGGAVPANYYGQVTTVAGTGAPGSTNGTAKAASFGLPVGITSDNAGNLYVTEFSNNDVRKITPAGVVTTLAGGSVGATNGQGAAASFEGPYGLTADASGNLYIADKTNQEIRKVTPSGVTTTFAGDGVQASLDGPAASAEFTNPLAVVFDAQGNMYIADSGNSRIRKIDPSGQVTTFAVLDPSADPDNNSDTAFGYLAIDAAGNLYIPYNNQVMKITPAGNITAIAGVGYPGFKNGAGASASFDNLVGIAVDQLGNVYVADEGNNAIRKITPAGVVSTLAGGTQGSTDGIGTAASFYGPYGITMDNTGGYIYVTDTHNNLIRRVTLTGYTIDKALPAGLSFDPKTGIITGTPTAVTPATIYTVTAYNLGGSSTTTVTISVLSEQTVAFPPLPGKTICDADFDAGATGDGPITYTSDNSSVATIVAGKVHIVGAGQATITATDGISQAAQLLIVTAAANASIAISTSAPDYCQGDTVTLNATPANAGTTPLYQWQVNGINVGANTANPVFTTSSLNSGDKIICIMTNNLACTVSPTDTSNTAVIFFDTPVTASVQIISSADGPICAGTPVTFTANAITSDNNPSYQWLVNGKDTGTNNPVFTANNLTEGDSVTCILMSNGKCQVNTTATSNAIHITLNAASLCTIVIPNTITPNGDGINDVWNITSLQRYPQCLVNIYTRYGSLIYSSVGYPKAWDGTYKNGALPVGTYYYVIDLKNGDKPMSGFITIVR